MSVTVDFLHLIYAAEFPQSCITGFLGTHAPALIVLNLHLEMRLDLIRQLLLEISFQKETAQFEDKDS
jgi:hypothetical protein